jgi:hypothetical protein
MKALTLLKKGKTTSERAERYAKTVKEDLFEEAIKPLERRILEIEDKIFELEDFNLETNLNAGMRRMDGEEVKRRFKSMIDLNYEKRLVELELATKKAVYNSLFDNNEE